MKAELLGDINERIFILKNISIFSKTEEQVLHKIAEVLTEISVKAGENLFQKGDEGTKMYAILKGSVKVHDGDYVFAILNTKQVFGEYALLDTELRSASVTAVEDTVLLVLEKATFYNIMVQHAQILQGILQVLVNRARQNNKLQEDLAREKKHIEEKNDEIKIQNEEILARNEEIIQQQLFIEQNNVLLQEQNYLITSSIQYAKHIQSAIMPDFAELQMYLPESFLFFRPKDVVSGDFYWFHKIPNTEKIIVVCSDCTGHGVPGAFMSFLGVTYLRQIIEFQGVTDVAQVLHELNKSIFLALKQDTRFNQDGMDLAICLIDREKQEIEFAGAKGIMFHIEMEEKTPILVKGDNFPIGGYLVDKTFIKQTLSYKSPAMFYMFSDGYRDQFGGSGTQEQKFMMRQFRELLSDISDRPILEQYQKISYKHDNWKGKYPQTDDVLVIGFRL